MNKEEFIKNCNDNLGIVITEEKYNLLKRYYELLVEWNKRFNLTTILEEKDVFLKHFYDSLCLSYASDLDKEIKLCDIGTGAGFPGLVIRIIFDKPHITLVESNGKKIKFLNEVIKELDLKNIRVFNSRAEEYAKGVREQYDIVTLRAVSALRIITELSIPILKINGFLLPLKSHVEEEIKESKNTFKELNCELIEVKEYVLPIENSRRTIPVIKKIGRTKDIYPRNYSKITKLPL